jgi:hypothetical protein
VREQFNQVLDFLQQVAELNFGAALGELENVGGVSRHDW